MALACGDIELLADTVEKCAAHVQGDKEVDEAPKGFVISRTRGGRERRAHFVGGCFRIPGEHYRDFEDPGQRAPEAHEIKHRCKDCFPVEKATERAVEDKEDASCSSGECSSSDASREPEQPATPAEEVVAD